MNCAIDIFVSSIGNVPPHLTAGVIDSLRYGQRGELNDQFRETDIFQQTQHLNSPISYNIKYL